MQVGYFYCENGLKVILEQCCRTANPKCPALQCCIHMPASWATFLSMMVFLVISLSLSVCVWLRLRWPHNERVNWLRPISKFSRTQVPTHTHAHARAHTHTHTHYYILLYSIHAIHKHYTTIYCGIIFAVCFAMKSLILHFGASTTFCNSEKLFSLC